MSRKQRSAATENAHAPAFSSAPRIATDPSSGPLSDDNTPPMEPIGVRAALTITASWIPVDICVEHQVTGH